MSQQHGRDPVRRDLHPIERFGGALPRERVFASRYGGLRAVRDLDMALMARVLGGGPSRGELLTFLFFDPEFIAALIDAGKRDARRWLARHPSFWCADASHDLDLVQHASAGDRDTVILDEWRTRRRSI